MGLNGFAELTLEARDTARLERFYVEALGLETLSLDGLVERLRTHGTAVRGPHRHEGGDRSVYVEDPEGSVVEVWDFFERGEGRRAGVDALR